MRISVAIPCYQGVSPATARALIDEARLAQMLGLEMDVSILPGMSLVHSARNILAGNFLNDPKRPDKLFFVDADTGWEPGALIRVAAHQVDVVAAGVRRRREPEDYAISLLSSGERQGDLIGLRSIGMAFTSISRECLELFRDRTPELAYEFEGKTLHGFFECPVRGGRILGEDVAFCERWRGFGGKIWLDPTHRMIHVDGLTDYSGCVGDWLKVKSELCAA